MTGIQYVTDEQGRKIAVQIDLRLHAGLWEEFEDVLVSEARRDEENIPLDLCEGQTRRERIAHRREVYD